MWLAVYLDRRRAAQTRAQFDNTKTMPGQPVVAQRGLPLSKSKTISFEQWILDHRADGMWLHPSLGWHRSRAYGGGINSIDTLNLDKGTVVAKIPKSLILSRRTVTNSVFRDFVLPHLHEPPIVVLAIAYLHELTKKRESHFYPYLDSLPVPNVPWTWTAEERELLKGTEVESTEKQKWVLRCVGLT
jgi:hypothetical protein